MGYTAFAKNRYVPLLLVTIVIILVVAGVFVAKFWKTAHSPVPSDIRKQVNFVIQLPTQPWQLDRKTFSYDNTSGVLGFKAQNGSTNLSITEQATPSQFNDIPQYFPTLLNKLNEYQSFGSINGTGYLVKPTELKGQQELVLNHAGTLIFMTSTSNVSENDWRQLLNNLNILK